MYLEAPHHTHVDVRECEPHLRYPRYVLDDEAGNHDTDRAERVSQDMQQDAMHVHVTLGLLVLLFALVAGGSPLAAGGGAVAMAVL